MISKLNAVLIMAFYLTVFGISSADAFAYEKIFQKKDPRFEQHKADVAHARKNDRLKPPSKIGKVDQDKAGQDAAKRRGSIYIQREGNAIVKPGGVKKTQFSSPQLKQAWEAKINAFVDKKQGIGTDSHGNRFQAGKANGSPPKPNRMGGLKNLFKLPSFRGGTKTR